MIHLEFFLHKIFNYFWHIEKFNVQTTFVSNVSLITYHFIYVQAHIMPSLPLILFGSMGMIAGVLSLIFPETLGTKLPDTVWEAERIGKSNEIREIPDSTPRQKSSTER